MSRRDEILLKVLQRVELVHCDTRGCPGPCWEWQGPLSGSGRGGGYARMNLDGQTVAVHRIMFTNFHGYIPGKKQLDHKCENRRCVSPFHTEMVTHKENQRRRDKSRKRRLDTQSND